MTYEELNEKILSKLDELEEINSAFRTEEIDEDEDWYENYNTKNYGKVFYGSLSNYLIFVEQKDDGTYVSLVCETEPLMVRNDWLFGKGIQPSNLDYEFSTSIHDITTDFSFEDKPIWEERI